MDKKYEALFSSIPDLIYYTKNITLMGCQQRFGTTRWHYLFPHQNDNSNVKVDFISVSSLEILGACRQEILVPGQLGAICLFTKKVSSKSQTNLSAKTLNAYGFGCIVSSKEFLFWPWISVVYFNWSILDFKFKT